MMLEAIAAGLQMITTDRGAVAERWSTAGPVASSRSGSGPLTKRMRVLIDDPHDGVNEPLGEATL